MAGIGARIIFFLTLFFSFFLTDCNSDAKSEAVYQHYCGSCHAAPSPQDLPQAIWENEVLPEMGARLGVRTPGFDPLESKPEREHFIYKKLGTYPEEQFIRDRHWEQIRDYVLANAPESLPKTDNSRLKTSPLFKTLPFSTDTLGSAMTTNLSFQEGVLYVSSVFGQVAKLDPISGSVLPVVKMTNPISSVLRSADGLIITEIGYLQPSDLFVGGLWRWQDGKKMKIAGQLQRPVFTLIEDVNQDGTEEIFICEFGHQTGKLSMLTEENGVFSKRSLLAVPGVLRVFAEDMNGDAMKDLVVLSSQAEEGVWILYQEKGLVFRSERIIRLSPLYGTSGFDLVDYDQDGDQDIVLVNGDNADLSILPKPYHGMRLFMNEGDGRFEEKFFLPINGVTNVIARDFDLDGDVDFMVSSFFPDWENAPDRSLVFLENVNPSNYIFDLQAIDQNETGRWLVMTAGDFDRDGDEDVAVGSFTYSPDNDTTRYYDWIGNSADLLLLKNKVKD